VLADHTEVPSGIGYAIEMRRVLARSLPEAFRSIPVRHLRPFVDHWHDSLLAMAPTGVAQPNMAVLTPGSLSSTYFEHVYLSRDLGRASWSKGGDLGGARRRRSSIKTLAGLRPVAHAACAASTAPLPTRSSCAPTSALGVTGLVEATRTGRDRARQCCWAQGLVETPALMPFLELLSESCLLAQPVAAARRSTCGGSASPQPTFAPWPTSTYDRAALSSVSRPRADRRRHAGSRRAPGAGSGCRAARPFRGAVSRDALAQPQVGRQGLRPPPGGAALFVIADGAT
jgi:uncharacterized circularly permuted ATP-grasp superfamily protein